MSSKIAITLPTGQRMPALGFGTWQATELELSTALEEALEAGYRHIDTAPVYENENVIGKVLKKWLDSGKLKREDLFVVTKVPPTGHRPGGVEKWIKKSLESLKLDYIDLYLVHTPFAFEEVDGNLNAIAASGKLKFDTTTDHSAVWREMEKQVKEGRARAIGLSNFNRMQIDRIVKHAELPVSNLQIELHVYFQQKELVQYCGEKGIPVTAYAPLGSRGLVRLLGKTDVLPDLLDNSTVLQVARKHKKTAAQVILKYVLSLGVAAIPKSTNAKRIKENIELFDWELDNEDTSSLERLDRGDSARICDFSFFAGIQNHPEYPF